MEDNKNSTQNETDETTTINKKLILRKRSSLKPARSSIKDHNLKFEEIMQHINVNKNLKKTISWESKDEDEADPLEKKPIDRTYSDAKTHYSDIVNLK